MSPSVDPADCSHTDNPFGNMTKWNKVMSKDVRSYGISFSALRETLTRINPQEASWNRLNVLFLRGSLAASLSLALIT